MNFASKEFYFFIAFLKAYLYCYSYQTNILRKVSSAKLSGSPIYSHSAQSTFLNYTTITVIIIKRSSHYFSEKLHISCLLFLYFWYVQVITLFDITKIELKIVDIIYFYRRIQFFVQNILPFQLTKPSVG